MDTAALASLASAPAITALVQLAKITFPGLATRFIPLLTLLVGAAAVVLVTAGAGNPITLAVMILALMTGLSSTGLYQVTKALQNPAMPAAPTDPDAAAIHSEIASLRDVISLLPSAASISADSASVAPAPPPQTTNA